MSNLMSTSQWIGFFRKAGLPANVAANYAIIFSDNRIQLDMLLDLSKEYLYDMGIKVMGDVIAILKFAKEFHNQLAKEKMIGTSASPINNKVVAERMVGRYTRPLVAPPVRTPVGQTERSINRESKVISLKRKPGLAEEVPVRKCRRVPPEEEGAYKIKMPSGTTERTRKILQMQQQLSQGGSKRSVFARLGDSAVSSSTDSKVSSSVFERLGPSGKNTRDDMPSSTVVSDFVKPRLKGPPLQYRGVLKMTVGKKRTVLATSPIKRVVAPSRTVVKPGMTRNSNLVKTVRLNQINTILKTNTSPSSSIRRIVKSPGTQGIFAGRKNGPQGMNVKSRLGRKVDTRNIVSTTMSSKAPTKSRSNVFARLGQ